MGKSEADRQVKKFGVDFDSCLSRKENGCLEWTGRTDKDGYGTRSSRYGERRAHRYAYARVHGEIPKGLLIRHKCDNPLCCDPEHLEIGTHQDNRKDTVSRKRHAFGERNNHAKITADDVLMIRSLPSSGWTGKDIASLFGLSPSGVSLILRRKNWKHI